MTLKNGSDFGEVGDGTPRRFRQRCRRQFVVRGWGMSEALNGVVVFAPDGKMIGRIALPERAMNPLLWRD